MRPRGGLYRQYHAGYLAALHVHQVTSARLWHEAGREVHWKTRPRKRRIPSGRCIWAIGCSLRRTTWASSRSTTVISRSTSRTSQKRRHSSSILSFHTSRARRPPPSQRTPRRSISGDWTTTIRRSGFTAPVQACRFKTSEPCWPIASHHRPPPGRTKRQTRQ